MSDAYAFIKRCRVKSATAKIVLFAIGEYIDERGVSTPSSAVLRADTYFCARTISNCLELLEADGFIKRERQTGKGGKRVADKITLIGYCAWVEGLKAAMPKHAIEDQVQNMHVQNMHQHESQVHILHLVRDTGVAPVADTKSSGAKYASRSAGEMVLYRDTLPVENLSSLCAKRALDPRFASFEDVWAIWRSRDMIRRSRRKPSFDAYCDAMRAGADPALILAGAKGYVAHPEKNKERGRYMLAFAKFVSEEEYLQFLDGVGDAVDTAEERRRLANFNFDGTWLPSWGPRPILETAC